MAGLIRPIHVGPKSQSLQEMLRRRNDVDRRDEPTSVRLRVQSMLDARKLRHWIASLCSQ